MNPTEYFAMGGYAAYVWPSLAITLVALVWNVIAACRLHVHARREALLRGAAPGSRS
ncbi:MAG: heme exporter protein CcmD [Gammaproteobacteria bacterium]